jgi:predicted nucleic acid-binding protein
VTWVVDASAVAAFLLGNGTELERAAMREDAHAPALLDVEVTQVLRGLLRGSKLDLATAERGREELGQIAVRRHPDAVLLARAWELRDRCTTYDALYVVLAEVLHATLVTRDAPLARGVADLVAIELTG